LLSDLELSGHEVDRRAETQLDERIRFAAGKSSRDVRRRNGVAAVAPSVDLRRHHT
jgi:hypothetical protein